MEVFLADLGHNQLTLSSDTYPLGIANLATYAHAHAGLAQPLEIRLFREPEDLQAALDRRPPEILGLSSYSWNHRLALHFAAEAKRLRPDLITVMGGPNWPLTEPVQEEFLRSMPQIDVAVRGPTYEGERAFVNLLRRYEAVEGSPEGLRGDPLPGNAWIEPAGDTFVPASELPRIDDLDEIPSPYLAGHLDPYFRTGYFPLLQISRGCPFSCAFCNSSVRSNSKIHGHSVENVAADLRYIAERVKPEATLCFADDNFGMYPLDEEVAKVIADLQDEFGWPRYIRTTTGKNKHERIIRVMRTVRGGLPMTAAVQSLDSEVLRNINRSNIRLDSYRAIQEELHSQGLQSYGELILCLPGETRETFMHAVRDLLASGVKRVAAHQLMLLHGAPLADPESRERWGFQTRFRVVARNLGRYGREPVVETEEMVVETSTFSFDEYLEARVFHLLLTIYYYEGNFEEAFELARRHGIEPYDLVVRLQSMLPEAPEPFRRLIEDFVRESQEELFDTREECERWAHENFEALVDGTLGGNLLSKYSMLGRFYVPEAALEFLGAAIDAGLPGENGDVARWQAEAVMSYLGGVLLSVPFAESLGLAPTWTTDYDVERWARDGYGEDLESYRLPARSSVRAGMDPERRALIESRVATFGEHPAGLGRFTRSLFARDMRRTVDH